MSPDDCATPTAMEIARGVRDRTRSAVETIRAALDAVDRWDPVLHFIDELHAETAINAAERLDRSSDRGGPLAGVPFLIKARTPPDAPIVARLVAADAIPIGTSSRARPDAVSQTFGWNGRNYTRNPWRLDRSPGGSSAGAAACVAAGVVPLATGGDTAGSLRIPASFSGVIGLKSTRGRVPPSTLGRPGRLTVAGIIGADLADVALATSIAGGNAVDIPAGELMCGPARPDGAVSPWRVAYSPDLGLTATDAAVDRVVRERLAEVAATGAITVAETRVDLADPTTAWLAIHDAENARPVDAATMAAAERIVSRNDARLAELFASVDVLITPTTPCTAHGYDEQDVLFAGDLCWAFNVSGHPAISVPAGLIDGLPVGVQVVAPPLGDDTAVRIADLCRVALPRPSHPTGG